MARPCGTRHSATYSPRFPCLESEVVGDGLVGANDYSPITQANCLPRAKDFSPLRLYGLFALRLRGYLFRHVPRHLFVMRRCHRKGCTALCIAAQLAHVAEHL